MSKLQLAYKQIYQQGMQVVFNHKYHPLKGLVGTVLGVTHYRVKIALAPNGVDSDVIILTKPKYLDVYHQPKGSSDADNGSQPNESLGVAADSKETTRNLPTTPQGNPIQPIILLRLATNLFMPFLTVNLFLYLYILNEINLICISIKTLKLSESIGFSLSGFSLSPNSNPRKVIVTGKQIGRAHV